jgi:RNA polymerase sigma factor for flagellar operon FliA
VRIGALSAAAAYDTRDALVMENVALVRTLAQRLLQRLPSQVNIEDLVSAGVLGLIEAAGRYKPSLGVPFQAFARRRIHGAMLDALRDLDWAPRSLRRLRRDVDSAIATVRARTGQEPDEHAIAAQLEMTPEQFEKAAEQLRTLDLASARELDAPSSDGTPLIEFCIDPGETAAQILERTEVKAHLARAIEQLPERERHILALYYEEELTLAEIGETIGVCESRVCQLRGVAVSRLRTLMRTSLGLEGPRA